MKKGFVEIESEARRTEVVRARTSSAEKKLIEQKAMDCGMSAADYLRSCALSKSVRSKTAATAIAELSEINIRLKNFCREGDENDAEFHLILKKIGNAIEKLPEQIEDE